MLLIDSRIFIFWSYHDQAIQKPNHLKAVNTKPTDLMKIKSTQFFLLACFLFLGVFSTHSQVKNDFDVRYEADIRGELTFIANNIVNRQNDGYWQGAWVRRRGRWRWVAQHTWIPAASANDPYDLTGNASDYNDNLNMQYIDVDSDPTTFSSSSATLDVPDEDCSLVRYAGLYWSAVYVNADRSNIDDIKFQVPGGTYQDITADEILFDGNGDADFGYYSPYACYADVTSIVSGLANPDGDYFVANVRASSGSSISGGVSGGWTMVVVYENPNLPGSKYITTFDGYAGIASAAPDVDIPISGFTTLPAPFNVNANIGIAALEGDNKIGGDGLEINANGSFTPLSSTVNPANNFFNSNISIDPTIFTARNPNSVNTLGWDVDLFPVTNVPNNNVIPNDATSAILRLSSTQDKYDVFFASFDVEIIEPNVVLEKKVNTPGGDDITGQGVHLGQTLDYVLTFQNIGNDDVDNYTIRDVLPVNVAPPNGTNFTAADMVLPTGVTYIYDPASRTVVFSIPNNLVLQGLTPYSIRMRVQVAENCFDFIDACSDLIQNLAYSTYQGVENTAVITDDPSVTDFDSCGFVVPGATNFLLDDLSDCNFSRTVELCGSEAILDAGDNFDDYVWVRDDNGNNQFDATDTVITDGDPDNDPSTMSVTTVGTYIVDKIVADPCKGFKEIITVVPYGSGTIPNPIIEYFNDVNSDTDPSNDLAGEIVQCSIDNDLLPKLFLCGVGDTRQLQVNILDAQSLVWEKLDEGSCTPSGDDCANKNLTCTWSNEGSGNNYLVSSAGKYRLSVTYQNGCTSRFYFNVFQNTLDILYNNNDIICTTDGNITITNLGAGYGYQLVDDATGNIVIPFSANNGPSFDFGTGENGAYRVQVTQLDNAGLPIDDACIFETPVIGIVERDVQYNVNFTPANCTVLGTATIQVTNADANYEYEIRLDDGSNGGQGTLVDSESAQTNNNFTFTGLNPGNYLVIARTDDGCSYSEQITIIDENDLELTAQVSQHISCKEGNIQMDSNGGQTPHTYAIWEYVDDGGTTITSYSSINDIPPSEFQTSVIFDILQPGDYTFVVVDRNSCPAISNTVTIEFQPAAEFNPTSVTDVLCFGESTGTIQFNLTDAHGYQLTYYLFDAVGFDENSFNLANALDTNSTGYFPGLASGDYAIVINQRKGSASCDYFEYYTISTPTSALSADSSLVQDYTCTQDAIIEAQNVTGGTTPYEYSIDGVNFVSGVGAEQFSGLTDGSYTITVRDANNCIFPTPAITINPLNEPSDLTFSSSPVLCPDLTSTVTVSVADGNSPFVFDIVAPTAIAATTITGNTADFNGLSPDTYTFRVTDAKGCIYTEDYTIVPVAQIAVTSQLDNNISCFTIDDGAVTFNVSSFSTAYDYSVTGPATFTGTAETANTIPLTGLAAGTYTITVTDTDTNCTATTDVTVAAPPAALAITNLALIDLTCSPSGTVPGSVTITAIDGWGGFEYELEDPSGSLIGGPQSSNSFTGLIDTSGNYTVTVRDAGGCEITQTFNLSPTVSPVLNVAANSLCYDNTTGLTLTANVTSGGVAPFQYRVNGGVYQSSNIFTGLAPGNHTVEVIDSKNCTGTASIDVFPTLTASASLVKDLDCTATPDAEISINITGGNPTFNYEVLRDGSIVQASSLVPSIPFSFFTTTAGTYEFVITDIESCVVTTNQVVVTDNNPPTVVEVLSNPLCTTSADGTVELQVSGGSAPYQIVFDGSAPSTQTTYAGLVAGTYNYSVTDAKGCVTNDSVTLTAPTALLPGTIDVVQDYTCIDPSATIRAINYSGGTPAYEFSIDGVNFQLSDTFNTGITAGTYTITIRDANGCVDSTPAIVIDPLDPPTDLTFSTTTPPTCPAIVAEVTVSVVDGNAPFGYEIIAPAAAITNTSGAATGVFTGLDPGTYTFKVTDAKGCEIEESYTVDDIPQVAAISQLTNNVSCSGATDGAFTFTVSDFVTTYSYTVENSSAVVVQSSNNIALTTPISVGPIGAETYTVTITDDTTNCTATTTMVIDTPVALDFTFANSPVTCIQNGTITVTATDGWGSYEYQLENTVGPAIVYAYQSSNVFTNVAAGTYNIYVRDAGGCVVDKPIALDPADTPVIALEPATDYCFDGTDQASLVVSITDGVAPYTYSLDGGAQTAVVGNPFTIANLTPGSYDIQVTDAYGCISNTLTNITIEPQLAATALLTQDLLCTGNAIIDVTVSGGYVPYTTYQVQFNGGGYGAATPIVGNTFTYNGAAADGTYQFLITDTRNCTVETNEIVITPIETPQATPVVTDVACFGGADGSVFIDVDTDFGTAPYTISFDGSPFTATTTYSGLTANAVGYPFVVRDARGCELISSAIVGEPAALLPGTIDVVQDYTCIDPSATIRAINYSGGTPAYEFSIDGVNFQLSDTFNTGITAGTYTITIRDANGCVDSTPAIVIDPLDPPTDLTFSTTTPPTCPAIVAEVTVSVVDGNAPFGYEIIAPAAAITNTSGAATGVFTGLDPGTYTFKVTDAKGCEIEESYTVDDIPQVAAISQLTNNVSCSGATDGAFTFTVSDFVTTYSYTVENSSAVVVQSSNNIALTTPISVGPIGAETYTVTITDDTTNCTATTTMVIDTPVALDFTFANSPVTCIQNGTITVTATDGWGSYEYQLENTVGPAIVYAYQSSNVFTNVAAGTYNIYVRDAGGCVVDKPIALDPADTPVIALEPATDYCFDGTDQASLVVSITDGVAPYTYSLDGGAQTAVVGNPFTIANLTPGSYDIQVTDAYGCISNTLTNITIEPQLAATALLTQDLLCTGNAIIDVTVSGGYVPYTTYQVQFNGGGYGAATPIVGNTFTYNGAAADGTYQFLITDTRNCTVETNEIVITPIETPQATPVVTDVACFGGADGSVFIDVDTDFGTAPYTISFDGSPFTATTTYSGLTANAVGYPFVVRDARGCEYTGNAPVNEPTTVTATITPNPITCMGANVLGSIDITGVSGGTTDYTYYLYDNTGALATTSTPNPTGPTSATNLTFADVDFGDYYVRIIDANGCEYNFGPYQVASPPTDLDIIPVSSGNCITGLNYDISIVGGTGPFEARIYDSGAFAPVNGLPVTSGTIPERNHQFPGLLFGIDYVFEVLDTSTNCTYIELVPAVPNPSTIAVSGIKTDITCNASANGQLDFTVTAYNGTSLSWEVFENLTGNPIAGTANTASGLTGVDYIDVVTGLSPGDYYILVRETDVVSTLCSDTYSFRIQEPTPVALNLISQTAANCNNNAEVTVRASGGTGPYTYAYVVDGAAVPGLFPEGPAFTLDPSVDLDWDIYAQDANGCISPLLDVTITEDPTPLISVVANDQCTALEGGFSVDITLDAVGLPPHTISIDGAAPQASTLSLVGDVMTISNLSSGAHTFTISDANGCIETESITLYPPLDIIANITAPDNCDPANSGEITVVASGGSGNYSYTQIAPAGPTQVSGIFTGLTHSVAYTFEVEDTTTNCTTPISITLPAPVDPTFTLGATDVSCFGGNNGTITVTLNPGNIDVPYEYSLDGGTTRQPSNVFTGLTQGTYNVTVISAKGCEATLPIDVNEPTQLDISASASAFSCNDTASTIVVTVNDATPGNPSGTAPYAYSFDNGVNFQTGNTYQVPFGSPDVNVVVRDANGCLDTEVVTIPAMQEVTAVINRISAPIDCVNGQETIEIVPSNGSGTYAYTELPSGNVVADPANIVLTLPGTYIYEITDTVTNCSVIVEHVIAPYDLMDVTAAVVTDATCSDSADGTIEVTVSGYTGAFNYQVLDNTGAFVAGAAGSDNAVADPYTFNVAATLPAGTYSVQITETAFPECVGTSNNVTIDAPEPLALSLISNVNANCNEANAIVTVQANGGTGPYNYGASISGAGDPGVYPYDNTVELDPTTSLSWDIYVQDANGCLIASPLAITINTDPTPLISVVANDQCTALEGGFSVDITLDAVGLPPHTISIDGAAPQASTLSLVGDVMTISNLSSGAHTFTISDANGCIETESITLYPPLDIIANITAPDNCDPANSGEITVVASGGSGNYSYTQIAPAGPTQVSGIFTGLTHSVAYTFEVEDTTTNCTTPISITLPAPVDPTFTLGATDVSCFGGNNGTITVTLNPGNIDVPYEYSLDGGTTRQPSNVFTGLTQGTYNVTVISAKGCEATLPIDVNEPTQLDISASASAFSCNDTASTIVVTVNDATPGNPSGTAPYAYSFDNGVNFQTGNTYQVPFGSPDVNVVVRDANGCLDTEVVTIPAMQEVTAVINRISAPIDCVNGQETIEIVPSNGSGTYAYTELPSGNVVADPANIVLTLPGTYIYEITDTVTNCSVIVEHVIAPYDLMDVTAAVVTDATCSDSADGTIEVTVSGYTGAFNYQVLDNTGAFVAGAAGSDNAVADPYTFNVAATLPAGTYSVQITETAFPECVGTSNNVTIDAPEPLALSLISNVNANCNEANAIVTVQANGGTGPYNYGASISGAGDPGVYPYDNTVELDPTTSLSWDIYVQDANGCLIASPLAITVAMDTTPDISLVIDDECASEGSFGITVSLDVINTGVAPYTMRINGSAFQSIASFPYNYTGLTAGAYTIEIRDANGCSDIENSTIEPELTASAIALTQPTCTANDGVIEFMVNGGSGTYTAVLLRSDLTPTGIAPTANQFIGVAFGDYIVRITDTTLGTPNCSVDVPISMEEPTPVTLLAPDWTNVSCFGGSDGTITINLAPTALGVNDNPPYVYEITDGTSTWTQSTNLFTGLPIGTYDITVTSNRNCIATDQVIISEPVTLAANITNVTQFTCDVNNAEQLASIEVTITTGTGTTDYFYSVNGGAFTPTGGDVFTYETSTAGNYDVVIRDANGCIVNLPTQIIDPLNTFTAAVSPLTAISCAGPEQVLITVTDNGNAANTYTYELLPIGNPNGTEVPTASNITTEFELAAPGSYTFRVTDTTTGCYVDTLPYEIALYDLIEVTATAVDPVICFGDGNGSMEVTVTGYLGTYDYEVFNQAGTSIQTGSGNATSDPYQFPIPGLSGGNYYVRVTETAAPLCFDDTNMVTILSPDMPLTELTTVLGPVQCTDDQGELRVIPTGGIAPYDITLTNTTTAEVYDTEVDVTAAVFAGLSAGDYSVTIMDAGGCSITNNYPNLLVMPVAVTANAIPLNTALTCYGDTTGNVSAINVLNGSGAYEYQLNYYDASGTTIEFTSGRQTGPDFTNLGAGIYSITVSDGWNCDMETNQVTITEPTQIEATLLRTDPLTCTTGVEFELSAIGGSTAYEYSLDNITFSPMTSNPMPLPETGMLGAGPHQYYVRDLGGACASVASNAITENAIVPLALTVDRTAAEINCNGDATAIIYASAEGGLGNYQYELFTDAALTLASRIAGPQSLGEFNGLTAGTYYVNVTSEDCTAPAEEVIITEPTPLTYTEDVIDVTCFGDTNGSITVTLSGGSGGYQYSISPNLNQFDTINTFTDLAPGDYTVIAQDMNGCFEMLEYTIGQPEMMQISATSTPEICIGEENGTITVTITGGTAPYSTSLNDKSNFVQDQFDFTDMASGSYLLFVRDANGCEDNIVVVVDPGQNLNATVEPIYECMGDTPDNYIMVTLEDPSVSSDVMYALDSTDALDMQLTPDFANITPGMHSLTIAHSNGCVNTIDFEILGFEPLTLELQNNNINEITAVATGGRGEYTFYFEDEDNGSDNTYFINRTDTYEVRVVDENGCEVIASIAMEFIDIEIPNFFTPDGDGQNDSWIPRNLEGFPEILTIIFDRYGREVYRMERETEPWDGMYHGTELPTGDYWYIIKLNGERDDREFIGHFTLYR